MNTICMDAMRYLGIVFVLIFALSKWVSQTPSVLVNYVEPEWNGHLSLTLKQNTFFDEFKF